MTKKIARRSFLRKVGGASLFPLILPAGAKGANERLSMGAIGTGRMGRGDMSECLHQGLKHNARIRAVCDVDANRAQSAAEWVAKSYREHLPPGEGAEACSVFGDFRELLARKDIDAVTISTPDHWHGFMAIAAARAGKDIYLQKPLTYSIGEGRLLVEEVRSRGRILQTGSQQRSSVHQRRVCQLVRNGRLGALKEVHVMLPPDRGTGRVAPMEVPANLDYGMWLGPAQEAVYTEDRVHPQLDMERPGWLQIERYCRGMITGWGAHMFDAAIWALGADAMPLDVEASAEFPARGLFDVHTKFEAVSLMPGGVRMFSRTQEPAGVKFVGEAGWASFTRGAFDASHREWLRENKDDAVQLQVSTNHMNDFYQAIRSRLDPVCPVEEGHRANTLCVLTHAAMKMGRRLQWDATKEQCVNDPEANALLNAPHRAPWTL